MTVNDLRRILMQYGGSEVVAISSEGLALAVDDVHLIDSNTLVFGSVQKIPV